MGDYDDKSAFPHGMPEHGSSAGLTKRELFAALAMLGLLARDSKEKDSIDSAIALADLLIERLKL